MSNAMLFIILKKTENGAFLPTRLNKQNVLEIAPNHIMAYGSRAEARRIIDKHMNPEKFEVRLVTTKKRKP